MREMMERQKGTNNNQSVGSKETRRKTKQLRRKMNQKQRLTWMLKFYAKLPEERRIKEDSDTSRHV